MNSITTTNLAIAYEDKLIVDGLNMNIPKGKITTIIGPNGCGKSTVLKTVGRILKPKEGLVYLNGDDIRNLSTKEVAQKMAILPQSPQAQGGLTVGELVSYGRFPHKKGFGKLSPEDKKVIEWALDITKLTELEVTMVDNLSGGQRQRVWIAMALAQQTDLILLDEPTTYLDMSYQLEVLELLYNLNREESCTIVMVLHDLNLAARFADYMIAIRDGSIIKCGTPKEIMTKEVLKDTFNIDAEIVWGSKIGRPTCISYELIK
ncbi:ABC transporter ATP-binding protein [Clostridium botulinum]|nr:ABC transporter ATP-binding protein [Clostridium botulinum]NFD32422.1 ABC transporter ATP-binding protein [Clostridium botulinum]NFD59230.1 ABC transporter ATP-binding protein [Clostridium botulinum]NFE00900.1 ABC transporter ATP-binding protein [Clostridium botulinum]